MRCAPVSATYSRRLTRQCRLAQSPEDIHLHFPVGVQPVGFPLPVSRYRRSRPRPRRAMPVGIAECLSPCRPGPRPGQLTLHRCLCPLSKLGLCTARALRAPQTPPPARSCHTRHGPARKVLYVGRPAANPIFSPRDAPHGAVVTVYHAGPVHDSRARAAQCRAPSHAGRPAPGPTVPVPATPPAGWIAVFHQIFTSVPGSLRLCRQENISALRLAFQTDAVMARSCGSCCPGVRLRRLM